MTVFIIIILIISCKHLVGLNSVCMCTEVLLGVDANEVCKFNHLTESVDINGCAFLHDASGVFNLFFTVGVNTGLTLCLGRVAEVV